MLTTISSHPLSASSIKSHGSETRTAPGYNPVEPQSAHGLSASSQGIGLDAGSILSNVNAEAATAGNRTILQTLALAIAVRLNIARRSDEALESLFLRIAAALEELPARSRAELESKTGLKALGIRISDLVAALRQPDSALAARLSAMIEAPLATPQRNAAAAAIVSYMQQDTGAARAAETLAMGNQARHNSEGLGLFSSTPPATAAGEAVPGDARMLQNQLKSLFEPGVAETRIEIATPIEETTALFFGPADEIVETPDALMPEPAALTGEARIADPGDDLTGSTASAPTRQTVVTQAQSPTTGQTQPPSQARQTEPPQQPMHQTTMSEEAPEPRDIAVSPQERRVVPTDRNGATGDIRPGAQAADAVADERPLAKDHTTTTPGRENPGPALQRTVTVMGADEPAQMTVHAEQAEVPADAKDKLAADDDRLAGDPARIRTSTGEARMREPQQALVARDTMTGSARAEPTVQHGARADSDRQVDSAPARRLETAVEDNVKKERDVVEEPRADARRRSEPLADRQAGPSAPRMPENPSQTMPPAAQNSNRQPAEAQLRAIAREILAERLAVDVRASSPAVADDGRMQTLLALKGLSEVPAASAWDVLLRNADHAEAAHGRTSEQTGTDGATSEHKAEREIVAQPGPRFGRDSVPGAFEPSPRQRPEPENDGKTVTRTGSESAQPVTAVEQEQAMAAKTAARAEVLGFGYAAAQPARDGHRVRPAEDRRRDDADDDGRGEDEAAEDPEQRRQRLARKATDDLLRPEPEPEAALRITRDSSEADRAYALYQRMGGF
jgi:hypothetical protein